MNSQSTKIEGNGVTLVVNFVNAHVYYFLFWTSELIRKQVKGIILKSFIYYIIYKKCYVQ